MSTDNPTPEDASFGPLRPLQLADADTTPAEQTDAAHAEADASGPIRRDSGLTSAEHLARFGGLEELPEDHPDRADNAAAYAQGYGAAEAGQPRRVPTFATDTQAKFWMAGYDDHQRGVGRPEHPVSRMLADAAKLHPEHGLTAMSRVDKSKLAVSMIGNLIEMTSGDTAFDAARGHLAEARAVCPAAK